MKVAAETSPLFLLDAGAAGLDEAVQVGECRDAGSPVLLSDGTLLASCVDHEVNDCIHCSPEAIERFRLVAIAW